MSVTISSYQTVNMAGEGAYLAVVDEDNVHIWPAGPGQGPAITMSKLDWVRIQREVRLAYMRAEGKAP